MCLNVLLSALITMFSFHLQKATTPVTNGIVQDEFFVSLKMSTYLVAFVVADLKNISMETNGSLVCLFHFNFFFTPHKPTSQLKQKKKIPKPTSKPCLLKVYLLSWFYYTHHR